MSTNNTIKGRVFAFDCCPYVEFWGYCILGMCDVRDVGCSGCVGLIYKMPGNLCIEIIFCTIWDAINFEIILSFLSNRFSTKPNSQYKNVNISRTKRDLI